MTTTDLKLDQPGSLPRPGPVGRLVRLGFGAFCAWYVIGLVQISGQLMSGEGSLRPLIWNGLPAGLFLISYVINIGFSRPWKKWPVLVSGGAFLALAGLGYLTNGSLETPLLARSVWIWELYIFSHLGLAFLISGLIATPGCEMRALHDLYTRLTGVPTKEHYCPVGPLGPIDRWEAGLKAK